MTEEPASDRTAFGELHSIGRGRFGRVSGGALGGGFHWLLDEVNRERGFLSEPDRRLLLTGNRDGELADATERNARLRIRNRVLSSFFDARYLRYIGDHDRNIIFQNARDAGYDLHFREGFKEFIRFTYLGLLELETEIDIQEIIEAAVREAERDHALEAGENVRFEVDLDVTRVEEDGVDELEQRYYRRDKLTRHELAVLVNSQHTNNDAEVVDAADIGLADALYYDARQPDSDAHGYSWEDPDRREAEEIVKWLRSVFDEYEIKTYDDLEVGMERITVADKELGDELKEKLSRLPRAAPKFEAQLTLEPGLSESDMALLHHILYNPDNIGVEATLNQEARPPTAGEGWDPAEDRYLQKFIARVQACGSPTGGEEGRERWNKVLELAEFDPDEWSEYMQEQRVERCATELKEWIGENEIDTDLIHEAGTWEDFWQSLPQSHAQHFHLLANEYGEDTIDAALEALAAEIDSE